MKPVSFFRIAKYVDLKTEDSLIIAGSNTGRIQSDLNRLFSENVEKEKFNVTQKKMIMIDPVSLETHRVWLVTVKDIEQEEEEKLNGD